MIIFYRVKERLSSFLASSNLSWTFRSRSLQTFEWDKVKSYTFLTLRVSQYLHPFSWIFVRDIRRFFFWVIRSCLTIDGNDLLMHHWPIVEFEIHHEWSKIRSVEMNEKKISMTGRFTSLTFFRTSRFSCKVSTFCFNWIFSFVNARHLNSR